MRIGKELKSNSPGLFEDSSPQAREQRLKRIEGYKREYEEEIRRLLKKRESLKNDYKEERDTQYFYYQQ